jgi:hypothetical protein
MAKQSKNSNGQLKRSRVRTRGANNNDMAAAAAVQFNTAVVNAIKIYKLTPAHTQLYRLIDSLRADGREFAAAIIESAIGNSEHVTPSAYILGGLTALGLYKCDLLPTPSQIKELDKAYHAPKR